jgi:hypothetical protein
MEHPVPILRWLRTFGLGHSSITSEPNTTPSGSFSLNHFRRRAGAKIANEVADRLAAQ